MEIGIHTDKKDLHQLLKILFKSTNPEPISNDFRIRSKIDSGDKMGLLAQRPITLVLMMINSCNYSVDDLVFNKFQIFIKILVSV